MLPRIFETSFPESTDEECLKIIEQNKGWITTDEDVADLLDLLPVSLRYRVVNDYQWSILVTHPEYLVRIMELLPVDDKLKFAAGPFNNLRLDTEEDLLAIIDMQPKEISIQVFSSCFTQFGYLFDWYDLNPKIIDFIPHLQTEIVAFVADPKIIDQVLRTIRINKNKEGLFKVLKPIVDGAIMETRTSSTADQTFVEEIAEYFPFRQSKMKSAGRFGQFGATLQTCDKKESSKPEQSREDYSKATACVN